MNTSCPDIGTPIATDTNKRELSSPFDPNTPKKARPTSVSSESSYMEGKPEQVTQFQLHEEDPVKISDLLRSTFELQLSQIVEDSVARVVVDFNKKLVSLETENAELKDRISHLEEQLN